MRIPDKIPQLSVLQQDGSRILVPLREGRLRIGRSSDNAVVLQDTLVSRHHAELEFDGESAYLHDVGGKNPIRVNGEEMKENCKLSAGDRIAIGQSELIFDCSEAPTSPVRVVPAPDSFEPGRSSISLDATVRIGKPNFENNEDAEKVYERLAKLYGLSEQLLTVTDEEELYDLVLSLATKETGAERGFFGLIPDGEEFDPYSLNIVRFLESRARQEGSHSGDEREHTSIHSTGTTGCPRDQRVRPQRLRRQRHRSQHPFLRLCPRHAR